MFELCSSLSIRNVREALFRFFHECRSDLRVMYEAYSATEVAFKLHVDISSLCYHKSENHVLAVGSKCDLLRCTPTTTGRRGYDLTVAKRFTRNPVRALKIVDDAECLLTLSEQVLSLHSLTHPFPVKAIVRVKPVQAFTAHVDKTTGDFYVTAASRRKITILKWKEDDFVELSNCDVPIPSDNPVLLAWCGRYLCYAQKDSYNMIAMSYHQNTGAWSGENKRLFPVGEVPNILEVADRSLVGFTRGETLTLVPSKTHTELSKKSGYSPTHQPLMQDVKFTDTLLCVVYDAPYLVGLMPRGRVEVRSLSPPMLIQSIALSKAVFLAPAIPGRVVVASAFDIWLLDVSEHLRKNVGWLVQERHFDLAVQLTDNSSMFDGHEKSELKRQAADNLFHQRKFDEAFALHAETKTKAIAVLALFPDLLPESVRSSRPSALLDFPDNDKKRAMLALGNYLSAVRTDLARQLELNRRAESGEKDIEKLSKEDLKSVRQDLQIVDTTLLQCHLKTKPMLVDSLLRLQYNMCSFEDAEAMLKKENQLRSLFVLYETRKRHLQALALLKEQAALAPQSEPFFHGVERTVDYLQTLGNTELQLVFEYSRWVLAKDPEQGTTIFTCDEPDLAKNLDREKVLDFLEQECMQAVIPYLEHVIYKWEDQRPRLHEALLEHYARKVKELLKEYTHAFHDEENMIRAGHEEGELGVYRKKMLEFLHHSLNYSPNTILVQLNHYAFCEERALILGRLHKHEEALAIYTGILHDFDAAEAYCKLYYNAGDPVDSQVFLHLVRAYLTPSDPQFVGAGAGFSEQDLPTPAPDVSLAIKVLGRHADKLDAVAVLSLIPDDTPLNTLSSSLNALVHATAKEAAEMTVRRAMCEAACARMEKKLGEVESTRMLVSTQTECGYCKSRIGLSAFVRPVSGVLEHLYCFESRKEGKAADLGRRTTVHGDMSIE